MIDDSVATGLRDAPDMPLAGLRVLELGSRIAVGACGRQLADLGATVFIAEPRASSPAPEGKWADRSLASAGKLSLLFDPDRADDVTEIIALAARCHVTLRSSDVDRYPASLSTRIAECCPIVCDITAFGDDGPCAGQAADESTIEAMTGVMDTTGFADGPPVPLGVPVIELSAGLYAAAAVVLAFRVLQRDGLGQQVGIALHDTAINALTTFLPAHFAGNESRRLGNGHSMAVPWNAFRAADGWVLICSASDAQWQTLAGFVDPALGTVERFATLAGRVAARAEVDALVARWVSAHQVEPLVAMLGAAGIACGAIVPVERLSEEPNLALRGAIATVHDPVAQRDVRVPGGLVRLDHRSLTCSVIPRRDDGRAKRAAVVAAAPVAVVAAPAAVAVVAPMAAVAAAVAARAGSNAPPLPAASAALAGLRVLEIGQFTTAPLAARHLASFGADVIKIEPAEGDSARAWAPHRNGTSHFFVMSNGDKRSLAIDLRSEAGRNEFARLLSGADVLVENMKPGSLERLGFGEVRLRALNPRLIYCAISGFGAHTVYPGRPAFDTVVQAMCGMMDSNRARDVPLKSGISAADIGGGQVGLLAIVAALVRRDRDGRGAMIDIAMQDVGAWLTQSRWNGDRFRPAVVAHDVATVAEACAMPQTIARELIVRRTGDDGTVWEMLRSPLRLARTPPRLGKPIGLPRPGPMHWRDETPFEPASATASTTASGVTA